MGTDWRASSRNIAASQAGHLKAFGCDQCLFGGMCVSKMTRQDVVFRGTEFHVQTSHTGLCSRTRTAETVSRTLFLRVFIDY